MHDKGVGYCDTVLIAHLIAENGTSDDDPDTYDVKRYLQEIGEKDEVPDSDVWLKTGRRARDYLTRSKCRNAQKEPEVADVVL